MVSEASKKTLAVLCGGGPAPGGPSICRLRKVLLRAMLKKKMTGPARRIGP